MIWIKENDKLVGYVPVLKKEYTDDEIRKMSEHCQYDYDRWSKSSALVMPLQVISYAYNGKKPTVDFSDVPKALYDITFDFCFWPFIASKPISYTHQIFDVFENLTLYKVEQYSISDVTKKFDETTSYLSKFLNEDTIFSVKNNFKNLLSTADATAKNIEDLFDCFLRNGLSLSHLLFMETSAELIEEFKQPRENLRRERLVKSIYQ